MEKFPIKVDNLTYYPEYPQKFIEDLKNLIIEAKKLDNDSLHVDHSNQMYKGTRYSDNERLLKVILGSIRSSAQSHIRKTVSDWQESSDLSMTAAVEWAAEATEQELIDIIQKALNYAASADYYYKYEKEWD